MTVQSVQLNIWNGESLRQYVINFRQILRLLLLRGNQHRSLEVISPWYFSTHRYFLSRNTRQYFTGHAGGRLQCVEQQQMQGATSLDHGKLILLQLLSYGLRGSRACCGCDQQQNGPNKPASCCWPQMQPVRDPRCPYERIHDLISLSDKTAGTMTHKLFEIAVQRVVERQWKRTTFQRRMILCQPICCHRNVSPPPRAGGGGGRPGAVCQRCPHDRRLNVWALIHRRYSANPS